MRLYAWAQFFPFVTLILILQLFPAKYTGAFYWIVAVALYALAKLFEHFEHTDAQFFLAGSILSGHTLKHLAAAAACFAVLRLFQTRQLIPADANTPQSTRAAPARQS